MIQQITRVSVGEVESLDEWRRLSRRLAERRPLDRLREARLEDVLRDAAITGDIGLRRKKKLLPRRIELAELQPLFARRFRPFNVVLEHVHGFFKVLLNVLFSF